MIILFETCTSKRMEKNKIINLDTENFIDLSSEILGAGKQIRVNASGNSMYPMIREGDLLLIQPIMEVCVRLGEVILLKKSNVRLLAHRVIKKIRRRGSICYVTQGDHTSINDGCIPLADILGVVKSIERDGRIINSSNLIYKMLGKFMVFYLRTDPNKRRLLNKLSHLLKKLPLLSRYLC